MTELELDEIIRLAQERLGVTADGVFGPVTKRAVAESLNKRLATAYGIDNHWLTSANRIAMHPSWMGGPLIPRAIVWHYTDTGPGSGATMALRRQTAFRQGIDRPASWHVTIERDGSVIQMAPFNARCFHAGGQGSLPIRDLGPGNSFAVGIELVGFGDHFPPSQVTAAKEVCRSIVRTYAIERRFAMVQHSALAPGRRKDPGPIWMGQHAENVLDFAYATP